MEKDTDLKLLQVIQAIAHEKKISFDEVARNLTEALKLTYEKYFPETIIDFQFDIDKNFAALYEVYDVIDDNIEEYDDYIQKPLKEAKTIDPNAKIGSKVKLLMKFKDFEPSFIKDMGKNFRIGNAVIFNKNIYEIYKNKKGQIINCTVESSAKNIVLVKLDSDGLLGEVTDRNLIPTEILRPGQMYDFYVVDVIEQSKGWPVILSRSHPNLVIHAVKQEVVEVNDGTIKIEKIARVAGYQTKIAVSSTVPNVNPVSTIIGVGGNRIKSIRERIGGEKLSAVLYNEDINKFLLSVFAPYEILKYNIRPAVGDERAHITVVIPREAQSAACGIHGSNTHVCAELLNASIDIVDPETVAELAEQGFSTNYITPDYSSTPLRFNKGDRNNAGGGFSNRSNSSGPREFRPRFNQQPDVRNESKWVEIKSNNNDAAGWEDFGKDDSKDK